MYGSSTPMWPARNLTVIDCEQDGSVLISFRSVGWITSNEKVQRGLGNKTDASWRQSTNNNADNADDGCCCQETEAFSIRPYSAFSLQHSAASLFPSRSYAYSYALACIGTGGLRDSSGTAAAKGCCSLPPCLPVFCVRIVTQGFRRPSKMGQLLSSLLEIFYTKKLDIVVIGLENRYVCSCRTSSQGGSKEGRTFPNVPLVRCYPPPSHGDAPLPPLFFSPGC
jgi:hypothetical protein